MGKGNIQNIVYRAGSLGKLLSLQTARLVGRVDHNYCKLDSAWAT